MMGTNLKFPGHLTLGHLQRAIRNRCRNLKEDQGIFLFINGKILAPMTHKLDDIVMQYGINGIIYIDILLETTFG